MVWDTIRSSLNDLYISHVFVNLYSKIPHPSYLQLFTFFSSTVFFLSRLELRTSYSSYLSFLKCSSFSFSTRVYDSGRVRFRTSSLDVHQTLTMLRPRSRRCSDLSVRPRLPFPRSCVPPLRPYKSTTLTSRDYPKCSVPVCTGTFLVDPVSHFTPRISFPLF